MNSIVTISRVVQLADCQTYVKTLHQMHLHTPSLILVPDTFLSATDASLAPSGKRSASTSMLVEYVREEFPGVQVEPVGRKYWNETGGEHVLITFLALHLNIKYRPRIHTPTLRRR